MKKILCIGEALIDMICTDKGSSLAAGNNFLKKPGGAPANAAAAIAALGGDVTLAAKVGNDPFGEQLISVMNDFGVSTQWIFRDDSYFTTMAFVSLMENGERDFVFNRGADAYLDKADIGNIDSRDYPIIHFGSATAFLPGPLQTAYQTLLEKALQQKAFISFDPNYRRLLFPHNTTSFIDQAWVFLRQCHFAKLSEEEAMLLTGCSTLEDAIKKLQVETSAILAITLGEKGALLGLNNTTAIIPSVPAKVVDTTGAGDAFVGAVLHQLSQSVAAIRSPGSDQWKEIIFSANKTAAKVCEYFGAMEAFRYLK